MVGMNSACVYWLVYCAIVVFLLDRIGDSCKPAEKEESKYLLGNR